MKLIFEKIVNILLRIFVKVVHYVFLFLEYVLDLIDSIINKFKERKNDERD